MFSGFDRFLLGFLFFGDIWMGLPVGARPLAAGLPLLARLLLWNENFGGGDEYISAMGAI